MAHHNGEALSSSLFGFPKGELRARGVRPGVRATALIINAVPTNALQEGISGDIKTLPLFSQWLQAEVPQSEAILWSSEYQSCFFLSVCSAKSVVALVCFEPRARV